MSVEPINIIFMLFLTISQLAKSPDDDTCIAPSTVMAICRPLTMANDSDDEKVHPPGLMVIVSFPGLMISASSLPTAGKGPAPIMPTREIAYGDRYKYTS